MKKTFIQSLGVFVIFLFIFCLPIFVMAEGSSETEVVEVTAEEVGIDAAEAEAATEEETTEVTETGTLIEIGNTTADETTIIIRTEENGETTDETIQIDTDTSTTDDSSSTSDLSNWIAGDQITFTAEEGDNSGELKAKKLKNRSFKRWHKGKNGWIKEIREDENKMDVEWAGNIYTLDISEARMVAGVVNPASLSDFQIGDRIRARVSDDGDGDANTWDAKIIVVLRRGETLFMRVTRWVVPAEITSIPEDTSTLPYTITAKVLESKFYEKGDVNNLVGEPGTEITIQINEKTKLVRKYLGKATIGEFIEGDFIKIVGRLNDETGKIDANLVKNNSIQALGVSNRISEVVSVNTEENNLEIKPVGMKNPITGKRHIITNGKTWTVQLSDETKIIKNSEKINLSDIVAGDIIRVRGVANKRLTSVDVKAISVVTDRFQKHLSSAD